MTHIMKIDEMANKKHTFRGLVLGFELDRKYEVCADGLQAIYQALYNDDEIIGGAVEFAGYAADSAGVDEFTIFSILREFIYDRLVDNASEKKILDTVYDGEHLDYLSLRSDMFEEFENRDYRKWASEVADLLGITLSSSDE